MLLSPLECSAFCEHKYESSIMHSFSCREALQPCDMVQYFCARQGGSTGTPERRGWCACNKPAGEKPHVDCRAACMPASMLLTCNTQFAMHSRLARKLLGRRSCSRLKGYDENVHNIVASHFFTLAHVPQIWMWVKPSDKRDNAWAAL